MTLRDMFSICIAMTKSKERDNPGGSFKSAGKKYSYTELVDGLTRIRQWCYPDLRVDDVCYIVRCRDCDYYKRYETKSDSSNWRKEVTYKCDIDGQTHNPDYYCANGLRKGIQNDRES